MADDIKIESGIPIPKKNSGYRGPWPFAQLVEVGHSFFVPDDHPKLPTRQPINSLSSSANHYAMRWAKGRKFTVRSVDGGFRCWRTK